MQLKHPHKLWKAFKAIRNPMATASPNNHSTTRELSLMLGQALNLLIDPMMIKNNTSKTIANIKSKLPRPMQLKIIKPGIWICVRILGQRFLLVNQCPYSLLDKFNSQWVDNGNLTLAFDHGLWLWKLVICDLFELFSDLFELFNHLFICPIVWHIQSYWFWIRFKLFVWKFQYT